MIKIRNAIAQKDIFMGNFQWDQEACTTQTTWLPSLQHPYPTQGTQTERYKSNSHPSCGVKQLLNRDARLFNQKTFHPFFQSPHNLPRSNVMTLLSTFLSHGIHLPIEGLEPCLSWAFKYQTLLKGFFHKLLKTFFFHHISPNCSLKCSHTQSATCTHGQRLRIWLIYSTNESCHDGNRWRGCEFFWGSVNF